MGYVDTRALNSWAVRSSPTSAVKSLERVGEVIEQNRWDDLVLLIAAVPDGFAIVPERSSVQVPDCDGRALANYPIPPDRITWVGARAAHRIAAIGLL